MHKNILVYGFRPYAGYTGNVTMDIIEKLKHDKSVRCVIFDVRFSRKMFESALTQFQPDLVIGLGQDSRAKKIRIERKAVNWRRPLQGAGRHICTNGPKYRFVNLKVPVTDDSTVTYDAGDYVCNYSMYIICEYCEKSSIGFAFFHFPIHVDVAKATGFVRYSIKPLSTK